jgi:hypothetical protein
MDPKLIGAFGVLSMCCICSSIVSGAMSGGSEEDLGAGAGGADPSAPAYTESCDDLGGGVVQRHEGDVDLDSCKQKCTDDLDCLSFLHGEAAGFCQLHDNKETTDVDVCDKGLKGYRDTTGKTPVYTSSCDDLGGGVIVRHESGKDLSDCKTECSADASCKGFIHKTSGFCQLHDNNDPYGADVCGAGLKVYRK